MSDIWDEQASEKDISQRDWNRLQDIHGIIGYREGIIQGQDSIIQKGFDTGYLKGSTLGLSLGIIIGSLSVLDGIEAKKLLEEIHELNWQSFQDYFKKGDSTLIDSIKSRYDTLSK